LRRKKLYVSDRSPLGEGRSLFQLQSALKFRGFHREGMALSKHDFLETGEAGGKSP
jgi:hypothetical protein